MGSYSTIFMTMPGCFVSMRFSLEFLGESDPVLRAQLEAARLNAGELSSKAQSELLIALAPHLEDFLAGLFGIETQVRALAGRHHELAPLYSCKRMFVQRRAMTKVKPEEAAIIDGPALEAELTARIGTPFSELAYARQVGLWLEDETAHADELQLATALCSLGSANSRRTGTPPQRYPVQGAGQA